MISFGRGTIKSDGFGVHVAIPGVVMDRTPGQTRALGFDFGREAQGAEAVLVAVAMAMTGFRRFTFSSMQYLMLEF